MEGSPLEPFFAFGIALLIVWLIILLNPEIKDYEGSIQFDRSSQIAQEVK